MTFRFFIPNFMFRVVKCLRLTYASNGKICLKNLIYLRQDYRHFLIKLSLFVKEVFSGTRNNSQAVFLEATQNVLS
jgi:hypothetical protein